MVGVIGGLIAITLIIVIVIAVFCKRRKVKSNDNKPSKY